MIYSEEKIDLFSVDDSYVLAHCISADFALGAGIAVEFNKRYGLRKALKERYPYYLDYYTKSKPTSDCLIVNDVLNLVTKERYWHKPTYDSLEWSLHLMYGICALNNIKKLAMPKIGCGLDGLQWSKVKDIVKEVFKDTDIEILVCYL